jgi:hypothetical protein
MSIRRRAVAAAFGICTLIAYVALPGREAGAATTGSELPVSEPVMQTRTKAWPQGFADSVFLGDHWYVVWAEFRGSGFDVMGGRVATDGTLLDGAGVTISTGVDDDLSEFDAVSPTVAADGQGQLMVVWQDGKGAGNSDIYASRVSPTGRVLDPAAIPVVVNDADFDGVPSIAWNGNVFLVAYQHNSSTRAKLITPAGAVSEVGEVDAAMTGARVAVSGSTFLVVGAHGSDDVVGRRIDGAGAFLGGPFAITKPELGGRQFQAAVAGGSNGWVAAWTDQRNGVEDVFGTRIAPDGTVLDPDGILISGGTGKQELPRVGMRGKTALVIWRDDRDGETDVFGAHVTGTGAVSEANGFPISATADSDTPGPVVAGPGGGFAAFTFRLASEAPYGGANRAFLRTVSPK